MNAQIELVFTDGHKVRFDIDHHTILKENNRYEVKDSISGRFLSEEGLLDSLELFYDDKLVGYQKLQPGPRYIYASDSVDVNWVFSIKSEVA